MALTAASINLSFTSNQSGCHRVCWRPLGAPTFDCNITVNCVGGGNNCTATIPIMVDNTLCVPETFEGYVQACCEDITSPIGQLPFSVTFTPNPNCKGYTVTCIGPVAVNKVILTSPGSGYPCAGPLACPTPVTFSSGAATATAYIGYQGISDQAGDNTIFPAGAGYTNGTYNNVPVINITGAGVGALCKVTVLGGVIVSADVIPGSNGNGYLPLDTFTFNAANVGGTGAGVVVTINANNTGRIQDVIVNTGGAYTGAAPSVLIVGSGDPAVGGSRLNGCVQSDLSPCTIPPSLVAISAPLNTPFTTCSLTVPLLPPSYTVVQDKCCSTCNQVTFTKPANYNDPGAHIYYEDCVTKQIIHILPAVFQQGTSQGPFCAVAGSWFVIELNPVQGSTTIIVGASC